eukprot:12793596-Heterocapsa_arctica.AAC.1
MPDADNQQYGHRVGRVQCGNWYMAYLQKPNLLQMQCDRGNRDGVLFATRQRIDCGLYWHAEEGYNLGGFRCEAAYRTDWQIP